MQNCVGHRIGDDGEKDEGRRKEMRWYMKEEKNMKEEEE
jgi:hypothetical protein